MKKIIFLLNFILLCSLANSQVIFGNASYYGPGFHGKKTANGETFNQFALTAAHKTLPLGTIVKVTNAQNNKSVYLKINDRGPYHGNRVLDVSTRAAELLGFKNKGTAYVKIEVVNKNEVPNSFLSEYPDFAAMNNIVFNDSIADWENIPTVMDDTVSTNPVAVADIPKNNNTPTKEDEALSNSKIDGRNFFELVAIQRTEKYYGVQLGVFSDFNQILAIVEKLESYNQKIVIQKAVLDEKPVFKLFVGKYENRAYADALKSLLQSNYADCFVVNY